MSSANHATAPPPYSPAGKHSAQDEATQPLLGSPRAGPSAGGFGGAIYDQAELGDVPDDFKVRLLLLYQQGSCLMLHAVWNDRVRVHACNPQRIRPQSVQHPM